MPNGLESRVPDARRRFLLFAAGSAVLMLAYAAVYQWALGTFEGVSTSYIQSLQVVVETFSTTGYGEQAGLWSTTPMFVLMILMQITGVAIIFLTLPLFLVPLVEDALRSSPPPKTDLTDHVVVCTFTSRGDVLVNELDSMGVPYIVVEKDRERAEELHKEGYSVIYGDPEDVETLAKANAEDALALVADDDDETNASIILSARQAAPDLRIVSIVEDGNAVEYHEYAGADRVVLPRRLLGESLSRKAATALSTSVSDAVEIGDDFEIAEVLVKRGSELEGETIAESAIGRRTGVNIIGAWFSGEFVTPPAPTAVIDEHTILLVTGRESELERVKELTQSQTRRHRRGKVVVAGYGEVGTTVADALGSAGVSSVVLDVAEMPGVDVVGDVRNERSLRSAGIEDAQSIVLALDSDTKAIFATLVIKHLSPETEVIARANDSENVAKLYRAGAEYVLALSTVSGRILASSLTDEIVIAPESQIELVRTRAPELVGTSLAEADVRARTNCTVVAVERDGELVTDVGPDFVVQTTDTLVVAGTDPDINAFYERYT
ncbi:Trk K+ transport system, NAD-binding component [Halopelagius inordinatus]|uniref:Trk K+ transport system, NAD-binding component n=1 Tax=Halopelagius inordinatus TaxID=553467 RepID=A0A1I2NRX4_9EURY|nr:NAD-binding protein [Halopelagius inordinatus]SFG04387.1 Trk K+ transport system, NAD-binding component [Halopelagius inordinatus]